MDAIIFGVIVALCYIITGSLQYHEYTKEEDKDK